MTEPGSEIGIDEIGIDEIIERYERQYVDRAEREGLLWALKVSDVGQAMLDIWREEVETYTRKMIQTRPEDPITMTQLQSLIYTRRNWIARTENAREPEPEIDPETETPRTE